jgi:protein SHQ1
MRSRILQLYRADYADDEYIQELIDWEDPANNSEVVYTEHEKMEMLRLPRKECRSFP